MSETFTVTPLWNQSNPSTLRTDYADYRPTDWVTSFLDPEDDRPLALVVRASSAWEAADSAVLIGNHQGHDSEGAAWPYDSRAVAVGDLLHVSSEGGQVQCFTRRRSGRLMRLTETPRMSSPVDTAPPAAQVAQQVVSRIDAAPQQFDQTRWFSGAAELAPGDSPAEGVRMCSAGWTAHVAGYTHTSHLAWRRLVERQGLLFNVEVVAAAVLGLEPNDAERLFDSGLHPTVARAALAQIAAGLDAIDWTAARQSTTVPR
ncbi:hypothetical protein ACFYMW_25310 [Streptomyces sp. NPDC006692]|uniref:hypothetical protein n=1 Tax=unclassified Streptomyces TaxID=2593676 RepID=UPI0034146473